MDALRIRQENDLRRVATDTPPTHTITLAALPALSATVLPIPDDEIFGDSFE